jgi:hypothetical protein
MFASGTFAQVTDDVKSFVSEIEVIYPESFVHCDIFPDLFVKVCVDDAVSTSEFNVVPSPIAV